MAVAAAAAVAAASALFFLDGCGVRAGVSRCDRRGHCSLLLQDN